MHMKVPIRGIYNKHTIFKISVCPSVCTGQSPKQPKQFLVWIADVTVRSILFENKIFFKY